MSLSYIMIKTVIKIDHELVLLFEVSVTNNYLFRISEHFEKSMLESSRVYLLR